MHAGLTQQSSRRCLLQAVQFHHHGLGFTKPAQPYFQGLSQSKTSFSTFLLHPCSLVILALRFCCCILDCIERKARGKAGVITLFAARHLEGSPPATVHPLLRLQCPCRSLPSACNCSRAHIMCKLVAAILHRQDMEPCSGTTPNVDPEMDIRDFLKSSFWQLGCLLFTRPPLVRGRPSITTTAAEFSLNPAARLKIP